MENIPKFESYHLVSVMSFGARVSAEDSSQSSGETLVMVSSSQSKLAKRRALWSAKIRD